MYGGFRFICLVCILACIASCVVAQVAKDKETPVALASITVIGNGEVQGMPDIAYVVVGVQTEDKAAGKAAATNATKTTAVISAILKNGIAESDIQTVNYSLSSFNEYVPTPMPTPDATLSKPTYRSGFRATNEVRVKVRDLSKIGAIIDASLAAGANVVQNVSFSIEDDSSLRKEALKKAVADAALKAKAIMESDEIGKPLGTALWTLVSVTENGAMPRPEPFMMGAMKADMAASTPIMTGEMRITAGVTVIYKRMARN